MIIPRQSITFMVKSKIRIESRKMTKGRMALLPDTVQNFLSFSINIMRDALVDFSGADSGC